MAVRRLFLYTLLVTCLKLGIPAWAGTLPAGSLQFCSNNLCAPAPVGQGLLSFTPVVGTGVLTISAGAGGVGTYANGGLIADVLSNIMPLLCNGDCPVVNGYLTLTSGTEQSGVSLGGGVLYTFNAGGVVRIFGQIPELGINSRSLLFTATFLAGNTFLVFPSGLTATGVFAGPIDPTSILLVPQLGTYNFTSASNLETSIDLNLSCGTLGNDCSGSVDPIVQLQTIPEPGTLSLLFGVGLVTFGARLRRRRHTPRLARPTIPHPSRDP